MAKWTKEDNPSRKSYIRRRYDGDTLEERQEYVSEYNNDLSNNPALITAPPLPTPLNNTVAFEASLGDGSREYLGLKTGFKEIDTLISGLQKFVLFAGAGGTGKSTLALQLATGVLQNEDCPVIYYSFEMSQFDAYTMLTQLTAAATGQHLTKEDILLHGNDHARPETITRVHDAVIASKLAYGDKLYVLGRPDCPDLETMEIQIQSIMRAHQSASCLVVIDSVQDIIPDGPGRTELEAGTAQRLVEMQQATGATILGISQKSKATVGIGGYNSVLGSVSWIHKPTTVVEFIGAREAINQIPKANRAAFYKLSNLSDIPTPVIARVIKGRNTGYGQTALKYHGQHGYFEAGRIRDYDTEGGLYDSLYMPPEPRTTVTGLQG